MALTQGMLERFKDLASDNNKQLLMIEISDSKTIYGYLREVAEDLFVIFQVKGKNNTADEIEDIGETTLPLNLVNSWTKVEPRSVPRNRAVRLGRPKR
jgi:hypothetical protein